MTRGGIMKAAILCALIVVSLPANAERAASIDYEFVARPTTVSADYDAPGLRFLAIKAIDGARVDAALWRGSSTVSMSVHGRGDTFHTYRNGLLGKGLAAKGYAVRGGNTRRSGPRANTDNVLEV